jgi:acyl-coenzyme A thioesterase PaaI-like protein
VHGGVISAVMDAAMTNRLFAIGITAVTARLSIQFHKPVKIGELAIVRAWILRESKRLYELKSEIIQNGLVEAEAEGKFIIKKKINIKNNTNMW